MLRLPCSDLENALLPRPEQVYDIVGPICESGDWLAKDRRLALAPDSLLAIMSAGAYAFTMSSQYNTRPRPEIGRASCRERGRVQGRRVRVMYGATYCL